MRDEPGVESTIPSRQVQVVRVVDCRSRTTAHKVLYSGEGHNGRHFHDTLDFLLQKLESTRTAPVSG